MLFRSGFLYLRAAQGDAGAQAIGSPLLKRRIACGSDDGCIFRAQVDAVKVYQALGAPITLPAFAQSGGAPAQQGAIGQQFAPPGPTRELTTPAAPLGPGPVAPGGRR